MSSLPGPAALPRLRIMLANPHLSPLRQSLDDAAARALHLTSYVSAAGSFKALGMKSLCCSTEPLKSTLDQLITSWQANSAAEMEKPLGRNARFALRQATDLPKSPNDPEAAIGYRFVTPGSWSQPDPVDAIADASKSAAVLSPAPEIDAVFTNRFGRECGQVRVQFLLNSVEGDGDSPVAYLIENSNILDMLRMFAACAQSRNR